MSRPLSRLLRESELVDGDVRVMRWGFLCPGCRCPHFLPIVKPPGTEGKGPWMFSADLDAPTITPSVHVSHDAWTDPDDPTHVIPAKSLCHSTITNGVITFLDDSHGHKLRGSHLLPPFPHPENGPPLLNALAQLADRAPVPRTWRPA